MAIIDAMDVRGLDLNLLIPLRVLLTERHVTRAADKLGITQPAMSASLARLRAVFGDQLLVRGPRGLTPTLRAQQLMDQLDQVIAVIEQLVALPAEFVPDTSRRTFTLIGTDFIETLLLPSLMADLAVEAPSVQVVFRPPDPRNLEALMSEGEVDLAVGYLPYAPKGLITSVAFHDRFVCIARRNHPQLSTDQFPLDQFVDLQHVQVLPRDLPMYGMPIDAALGALGFVRRVALWHPSFQALPGIVAKTDLVATLPRRLAMHAAQTLPIVVYDPPVPLPTVDFSLYWHARSHEDSGHKWLRTKVADLLRSAGG
ncbi:MAG: Transcriptional regulator [Gammaproteobacteria bacterium]|nr:Transcriptional regulator [Gammaproteobacteria bacterium]